MPSVREQDLEQFTANGPYAGSCCEDLYARPDS